MKKSRKITVIIAVLAALAWLTFIYSNSMADSTASASTSTSISAVVNEVLNLPDTPEQLAQTDHAVRKSAHFFEFMVLALPVFVAVYAFMNRLFLGAGLSLIICSCCAAIDESLQFFSPGRGPMVADWALDTSASLFCTTVLVVLILLITKRRAKYEKAVD